MCSDEPAAAQKLLYCLLGMCLEFLQPKTLRDIRRDMFKQREWRNDLDRMKVSHVVRCFMGTLHVIRNV